MKIRWRILGGCENQTRISLTCWVESKHVSFGSCHVLHVVGMIIYQLQPRLFQAVQWLHWRKLNQTCGDRRKRRSCLVVTMIVKFNNSFLESCISNLEGPLASSLLGHEFHSDSMFPNSGPVLRCIYVLRHWHWIKLLRFGGGNSGLRLWNYDLHFRNKFDSVQSIYGWNAVTNSRDNVALRSFFSFTVSGLYAPNCSDSVIAEVLAQECCLHNFNQFWLITVDLHF